MYIAYDLFIDVPILRSTLYKIRDRTLLQYVFPIYGTLLADVFHGCGELILEELTLLSDLLAFLQEVLSGRLHRGRQHVGFLGAAFLLVGGAFVAGVDQSGDLRRAQSSAG